MSEALYSDTIQTARREKLESFLQFVETERADIHSQRDVEAPVQEAPETLATVIASDQTHHFTGGWKHFAMLLAFGGVIGQRM
jgi:hypothetical protein